MKLVMVSLLSQVIMEMICTMVERKRKKGGGLRIVN